MFLSTTGKPCWTELLEQSRDNNLTKFDETGSEQRGQAAGKAGKMQIIQYV